MPATPQTNYESAIDRAIQRDRLIQERALEIVKSFGPQIGSGSGMQPSHFISEAFRFAESFTVFCEQRESAIQVAFEPKAEVKIEPKVDMASVAGDTAISAK